VRLVIVEDKHVVGAIAAAAGADAPEPHAC
jgi:hypothetical protein